MLPHCFLALSPSYSFTHTNTHTAHTSASGCSDPLGGLELELVNFRWTHHGNDFPLASLLFQAANTYCLKETLPRLDKRSYPTSSTGLLVGHISILKCFSNLCQNIEVLEFYHYTVSYLSWTQSICTVARCWILMLGLDCVTRCECVPQDWGNGGATQCFSETFCPLLLEHEYALNR